MSEFPLPPGPSRALVAPLLRPRAAELCEPLVEGECGVRVVSVNRLKVLNFDGVAHNSGVGVHLDRYFTNHIFYKAWVLVCLFGDKLLVWALEYGVEGTTGRFFDHLDQVLDPHMVTGSDGECHLATLVVGTIFADLFATGAESRDLGFQLNLKVDDPIVMGFECAKVLLHPFKARHRSLFADKERELDFKKAIGGVQFVSQFKENSWNAVNADLTMILAQDLEKTTHVGPFDLCRKAYGQRKIPDRVLPFVCTIKHNDRVLNFLDSDLVDGDIPGIGGLLDIWQSRANRKIRVVWDHGLLSVAPELKLWSNTAFYDLNRLSVTEGRLGRRSPRG